MNVYEERDMEHGTRNKRQGTSSKTGYFKIASKIITPMSVLGFIRLMDDRIIISLAKTQRRKKTVKSKE